MKITFIVNSFNRRELLTDALRSLEQMVRSPEWESQIVIYDAGSTDGSIDLIRQSQASLGAEKLQFVVAEAGEDSSFAAGLNRACAVAKNHFQPDYFAFFETDNYAESAAPFRAAISLLEENATLGAVGFTVTLRDGRPCGFGERTPLLMGFALGPQIADLLRLRNPRLQWSLNESTGLTWSYCEIVYTSPLVIRADVWDMLNGMDAQMFPFAACDLDLALRMKAGGYLMGVIQAKGIFHDNLGLLSAWSSRRAYSFHQGTFRLLRRHVGPAVWLAVPLLAVRHLCEAIIFAVGRPGSGFARATSRFRLLATSLRGYP
jgi:GT2 family glycosyltransferase